MKNLAVSALALLLLSACANRFGLPSSTPIEIFYKDGRAAYIATCNSMNWGPCLERAGMICKEAGYTVLEQANGRGYGQEEKELIFICKAASADKKPSAN